MYDKLGWLTVQQLVAYHTSIAVYRIRQNKEPEHLSSFLSRDNMYGNIIVKNSSLGLYRPRKELKIGIFKKKRKGWIEENVPRFAG